LRLGALSADGKLRVYEALDVMNLGQWSHVDELDVPRATCFAWGQHSAGPACVLLGYSDGHAAVWAFQEGQRAWREVATLEHREAVHSVAWAPHVGRATQLLATAGRDGVVRVHSLRLPVAGSGAAAAGWEVSRVAQLHEHGQQVWRVEWNATGTLLASSADDGTVRVWQPDATGARTPRWILRARARTGAPRACSRAASPSPCAPQANGGACRLSRATERPWITPELEIGWTGWVCAGASVTNERAHAVARCCAHVPA
jgi:nucleoporin SEH1